MKTIELNTENLIAAISFTAEDYNAVADSECASFELFVEGVIAMTEEQGGTLEDAIFIAEDAYAKLCESHTANPDEGITYLHDAPGVTYQAAGDYSLANPDCDMKIKCLEEGIKIFGESFRTVEIGFMECFPYPSSIGDKELEKRAAEVARFLIEYEDSHAIYTLYDE